MESRRDGGASQAGARLGVGPRRRTVPEGFEAFAPIHSTRRRCFFTGLRVLAAACVPRARGAAELATTRSAGRSSAGSRCAGRDDEQALIDQDVERDVRLEEQQPLAQYRAR